MYGFDSSRGQSMWTVIVRHQGRLNSWLAARRARGDPRQQTRPLPRLPTSAVFAGNCLGLRAILRLATDLEVLTSALWSLNYMKRASSSSAKREALALIDKLPDDATTQDIMAELYFKEQVDRGLRDVAEGQVVSHEELKKRVARWRKSAGR